MIQIINPKVHDNIATATLKIYSACCKTDINVMAHFDGHVFSDAVNIDTGSTIYVQVQADLVKEWLKCLTI